MIVSLVIICSVSISIPLAYLISYYEGEILYSLKQNDKGEINPDLKWWIFLSLVHVGIMIGWAQFLENIKVITFSPENEIYPVVILKVFIYWILFEVWYWYFHRSQHKIKWFGWITQHKGGYSSKFHHGMTQPFGPDYLTSFSAHPLDSFIVQMSAQSPFYIFNLIDYLFDYKFEMSQLTYALVIMLLSYGGVRAHTSKGFGGKYHYEHHQNGAKELYSFTGWPPAWKDVFKKLIEEIPKDIAAYKENKNRMVTYPTEVSI